MLMSMLMSMSSLATVPRLVPRRLYILLIAQSRASLHSQEAEEVQPKAQFLIQSKAKKTCRHQASHPWLPRILSMGEVGLTSSRPNWLRHGTGFDDLACLGWSREYPDWNKFFHWPWYLDLQEEANGSQSWYSSSLGPDPCPPKKLGAAASRKRLGASSASLFGEQGRRVHYIHRSFSTVPPWIFRPCIMLLVVVSLCAKSCILAVFHPIFRPNFPPGSKFDNRKRLVCTHFQCARPLSKPPGMKEACAVPIDAMPHSCAQNPLPKRTKKKHSRASQKMPIKMELPHKYMPTHSALSATLVSQSCTAQRMSVGTAHGKTPFGPGNPTPLGDDLVGLRFSKQSAQYTCVSRTDPSALP